MQACGPMSGAGWWRTLLRLGPGELASMPQSPCHSEGAAPGAGRLGSVPGSFVQSMKKTTPHVNQIEVDCSN
jgi:hypothetical protein